MPSTQNIGRPVEMLLVEDNPADARLFSAAMKGFDRSYSMKVVGDGIEALDYLQKKDRYLDAKRPDFIFLDWNLPGKDGGKVLQEIRQDEELKDIPVMIISGLESEEVVDSAYKTGANMFLHKPMNFDRFAHVLLFMVSDFINKRFPKTQ